MSKPKTPIEKRIESCKLATVEMIRQYPGIAGSDERMPMAYRKVLRALETEGRIEHRDGGWHAKS